jgi:TonB family protein
MRKIVSQAEPAYPEMARRMRTRGEARLELLIGSDGRVKSAKPVSGNPLLSAAAVDAARKSRYEPGLETTMVVVYHFPQ